MIKKHIGAGLVVLGLLLSLGSVAAPAQAASLTSAQVSAVISLLQSFGVDAGTIASVNATLGGSSMPSSSASCLTLSYNLYAGLTDNSTNGQVSQLQQFLGVSSITGYFGPMTQQAVQNWQASHGIVSSGSPDTTGYGFVGPATRAAMACSGSQPATPSNPPVAPTSPITNPSASFDQNGQTLNSVNPTLSGSATGVNQITINVFETSPDGGAGSVTVPVTNGRWSASVDVAHFPTGEGLFAESPTGGSPILPNGPFEVDIYNSATENAANKIGTGTFTINASQASAAPTCTMTASPSTVLPGQSSAISWTSQNATQANDFIGLGNTSQVNGSQAITVGQTMNYHIDFSGPGGTASCSATITVNAPTGSATIDSSSLVTVPNGPTTITGSATNSSSLWVYMLPGGYTGSTDYASVAAAAQSGGANSPFIAYPNPSAVSNGRWSAYFGGSFPSYNYTVVIYDGTTHALLTTGTLLIKG